MEAMYCIVCIITDIKIYSTDDRYFKMKHCDIVTKFMCIHSGSWIDICLVSLLLYNVHMNWLHIIHCHMCKIKYNVHIWDKK